jgi:hypothetical protein
MTQAVPQSDPSLAQEPTRTVAREASDPVEGLVERPHDP